jgi:PAS domain S-box-containing protein
VVGIHPDDLDAVVAACDRHFDAAEAFRVEYRLRGADGVHRWQLGSAEPLRDPAGRFVGFVGSCVDIHERKAAEAALVDSRQLLRAVLDAAPIGIWLQDSDGRALFVNQTIVAKTGHAEADRLAAPPYSPAFYPPGQIEAAKSIDREALDHDAPLTRCERVRFGDGKLHDLRVIRVPLRDARTGARRLLGLAIDETPWNEVNEALRWNRALLGLMADASPLGFLVVDNRTDELLYFNRRFCQLWGIEHLAEQMRRGEVTGHTLFRDCAPMLVDAPAFVASCAPLQDEANRAIVEDEIAFTGGRTIRRFSTQIRDDHDRYHGRYYIFEDVTAQRQAAAARDQLEATLRQADKMSAVGRLAGGVAHDFNNMLGVILGLSQLVMEELPPTEPVQADLRALHSTALRSADLTRQLLAFARQQEIAPTVLDLNQAVPAMLTMLRRLVGEDVALRWAPSPAPCPVLIDPSQLDQVLANLCVNARDAIAGVGTLSLETSAATVDAAAAAAIPDANPGDYVRLVVRDDGAGMDAATLDRIFEPFYTTKRPGHGTGLGLATVYGAIRQNGGFITVTSAPGAGTAFELFLPRHGGAPTTIPAPPPAAPASGGETILIVEDEQQLLSLCTRILTSKGYVVLGATTPEEALDRARAGAPRIDLLLTDVVLPGQSGPTLAATMRDASPGLRVLFMSGYPADAIARRALLPPDAPFLQKPISVIDLVAAVRDALDRP